MTFMAILGFSLVVTVLLVILRKERPEIAVLLGMAATGLILAGLLGNIGRVLAVF